MPVWVLIVAPVGVVTIIALTWFFGGASNPPITREWLDRFFASEEPPRTLSDHMIADDGKAALVVVGDTEAGIVARVGDGLAWRPLGPSTVMRRRGAFFIIHTGLPTFPRVKLKRSEETLPASLETALQAVRKE